ncbi:Hypothetical protein R9X50_00545400 [Acrodontium crateriforme]|uniref:Uncharacterized protein n=1 Tax=Acrodontium crateriforme TaxID=150365 RepID=A0AAQ3M757_9PEZI|nr:Hypothetical protein R9X50_00545400 [Acrodontium crateriforme]
MSAYLDGFIMSDETFHVTKQDVQKLASKNDPDAPALQSIVDSAVDKNARIENRKANLPLPEQPPRPSDFNSADASINATGAQVRDAAARAPRDVAEEPKTGPSAVRVDGEVWKTNAQV